MEKLYGPIMQMGFVVDDFDGPIKHWTEKLNVGPFFILEHLDLKDFHYKGNKSNIDFSVAISFSGDMQIELIKQHCDTPSIYNEYSEIKRGDLHHICRLTPDINNDIKILENQGYKNIQDGETEDGGIKFTYLDAQENYGSILELAELAEENLVLTEAMKNASKNWDKKASTMELEEILT
ncbi:MAG: VOC family protein, partial [Pseudomonadota bacterium]|nr:VOC family protein [Pseudomonadota bacterium]